MLGITFFQVTFLYTYFRDGSSVLTEQDSNKQLQALFQYFQNNTRQSPPQLKLTTQGKVLGACHWLSARGDFANRGDVSHHHKLGDATGIGWVEARDVVKYPPMHRAAPTTKNHPAPNVNSAKAEKP